MKSFIYTPQHHLQLSTLLLVRVLLFSGSIFYQLELWSPQCIIRNVVVWASSQNRNFGMLFWVNPIQFIFSVGVSSIHGEET